MSNDWIEISSQPLNAAAALHFVTTATAGGIDIFLGTTRAEKSSDDRELIALHYEAYEQMATEQLHALANTAREKWPIEKLAILHRIGLVKVSEPSVIIAVSTPHRADAFDACRFLIDQLKAIAAIWKKEIWNDGSESWKDEKKH